MEKILVTSGLPYSNGNLHVGHIAGAYLPADIYVRFKKQQGADVRFVCGSDDHGVAIMLAAEREGTTPAELSRKYCEQQRKDFEGLNINFDVFGSTSRNKYHKELSQDFFLKIYEKGLLTKQSSQQFYDEEKQMFLPDRFVKGTCGYCDTPNQNGDQCENCGKVLDVEHLKDAVSVVSGNPAVVKESVHWFIDLTEQQGVVEKWLETAELRSHTKSFVKGLLSQGLVKRAMTRDLDWGIPVPLDDPDAEGKVLYVWFDAPIGYVSNTKEFCETSGQDPEKYTDWWKSEDCKLVHFIGEDNTIFHCVIWIAMLEAEGSYQLPTAVPVNQFVNIQFPGKDQEKISKSRGTAVWIKDYLEEGNSVDMLRYYLTAIAPERARTVYKPEDLIQKNNADLANTLGNFLNRIVSFSRKHCGEEVPAYDESKLGDFDKEFIADLTKTHEKVTKQLDNYEFKNALETVIAFARTCNKYVDEKAPWKTRKDDMEATKLTLALSLNAIKYLSVVLTPFIPDTAAKLRAILGLAADAPSWDEGLTPLNAGDALNESVILFEKLELPSE